MNAHDPVSFGPERFERLLREATSLTLRFDRPERETIHVQARYVVDPVQGRLIADGPPLDREPTEAVAFIPDLRFDAVEVMVRASPVDPQRTAACDRHQAYFGKSGGETYWGIACGACKWSGKVLDDGEIDLRHPWIASEGGLLRELNGDRARLTRRCAAHFGREVAEPTAVGVDPYGIHVRIRGGVLRVGFEARAQTQEAARAAIALWFGEVEA